MTERDPNTDHPDGLVILIHRKGEDEPSRLAWSRRALRFENTRKSAARALRALADELERETS